MVDVTCCTWETDEVTEGFMSKEGQGPFGPSLGTPSLSKSRSPVHVQTMFPPPFNLHDFLFDENSKETLQTVRH